VDASQGEGAAQAVVPTAVTGVVPGGEAGASSAGKASKSMVPPSVAIACIVLGVLLMALTLVQARRRRRGSVAIDPADERSANRVGVSYATTTTNQAVAELAMQVKRMHTQLRAAHERIEHLEQQGKAEHTKDAKGRGQAGAAPALATGAKVAMDGKHDGRPEVKLAPMTVVGNANPLHQQVYGMADAGLGAVDIARATGLPTGQVELILNLRKALGLSGKV
jgi:hypothetical protein